MLKNIYNYNSIHSSGMYGIIKDLCELLAAQYNIPGYSIELSSRPVPHNCIHIYNPIRSTDSASCTSLPKFIQVAKFGITIGGLKQKLSLSLQRIRMNWTTSDRKPFQTLQHYLPIIIPVISKSTNNNNKATSFTNFIHNYPVHRVHEKL